MNELCVAHLVREKNGPAAFKRFLDTYRANPAGVDHDLLIVFKGFSRRRQTEEYDRILAGVAHRRHFVADAGLDIGPYFQVVKDHDYRYFCFLNSFSRILSREWLRILHHWVKESGVGLAGATGSWQSVVSDYLDYQQFVGDPKTLRERLRSIRRSFWYLRTVKGAFLPFPNYHIRTNAFVVAREVLAKLHIGAISGKWDAYRFESGTNGLSQQVQRLNLSPIVAGKDGEGYERERWPLAETFWLKNQGNLLVADNQTSNYASGDAALRERLAYMAWRCWPDGTRRESHPGAEVGR